MMNNNDNNNNFYRIMAYVFIGLFLISLIICFCVFIYFKWFKGKYIIKKYILITIKMNIKSLKIKNESMFQQMI